MSKQNHIFTKIRSGSQAEVLAEILSRRTDRKSGKTISTVADLAKAGMGLKVSCSGCGEATLFKGRGMKEKFGSETHLRDLRDPCESCGSMAVSRIPEAIKAG